MSWNFVPLFCQSWADAKVFAFVRFRAPDAKAFCQSSACVPEILLRLASVWGEWVNTVGRTVRFLVAKALNFKIRENSRPRRVFRVRVIHVCQQNAFASDAQKTWTRKRWERKTRRFTPSAQLCCFHAFTVIHPGPLFKRRSICVHSFDFSEIFAIAENSATQAPPVKLYWLSITLRSFI